MRTRSRLAAFTTSKVSSAPVPTGTTSGFVPCHASEFLNEGTGPAVRFGFFGGEEDGGELFRADHQVDIVFRA